MRDMPLRERIKKSLEIMQHPSIQPGAKPLWLKALLKASIDPEAPSSSPPQPDTKPDARGRKPAKQK